MGPSEVSTSAGLNLKLAQLASPVNSSNSSEVQMNFLNIDILVGKVGLRTQVHKSQKLAAGTNEATDQQVTIFN